MKKMLPEPLFTAIEAAEFSGYIFAVPFILDECLSPGKMDSFTELFTNIDNGAIIFGGGSLAVGAIGSILKYGMNLYEEHVSLTNSRQQG